MLCLCSLYVQTQWGRELSPSGTSVSLVREFMHWSSPVTLLTPTLHGQDPEHPEWPEHWSSGQAAADRCGSDFAVFGKQLPLGLKIKDQPFSILSRESRNLIFFLWVNRNGSLIRRHNKWTWELFKFCFLLWGKEFVLVSELLLEMRTRKAKLGLVIVRHVTALSLAASASEQAQ